MIETKLCGLLKDMNNKQLLFYIATVVSKNKEIMNKDLLELCNHIHKEVKQKVLNTTYEIYKFKRTLLQQDNDDINQEQTINLKVMTVEHTISLGKSESKVVCLDNKLIGN